MKIALVFVMTLCAAMAAPQDNGSAATPMEPEETPQLGGPPDIDPDPQASSIDGGVGGTPTLPAAPGGDRDAQGVPPGEPVPVPPPSGSVPSAPVPSPSGPVASAPVPSAPVPSPSGPVPSAPVPPPAAPVPSPSAPAPVPSAPVPSPPVPVPSPPAPVPPPPSDSTSNDDLKNTLDEILNLLKEHVTQGMDANDEELKDILAKLMKNPKLMKQLADALLDMGDEDSDEDIFSFIFDYFFDFRKK